jgi:hypothetical protein
VCDPPQPRSGLNFAPTPPTPALPSARPDRRGPHHRYGHTRGRGRATASARPARRRACSEMASRPRARPALAARPTTAAQIASIAAVLSVSQSPPRGGRWRAAEKSVQPVVCSRHSAPRRLPHAATRPLRDARGLVERPPRRPGRRDTGRSSEPRFPCASRRRVEHAKARGIGVKCR